MKIHHSRVLSAMANLFNESVPDSMTENPSLLEKEKRLGVYRIPTACVNDKVLLEIGARCLKQRLVAFSVEFDASKYRHTRVIIVAKSLKDAMKKVVDAWSGYVSDFEKQ